MEQIEQRIQLCKGCGKQFSLCWDYVWLCRFCVHTVSF